MSGESFAGFLNELYRQLLGLPEQASERAVWVDALHYFEITVMQGVAALIGLAVIWFSWRYRRRPGREHGRFVRAPLWLELGIYGALLALFVGLWVVGFRQYLSMTTPPDDSLEVYVTAKQWMWKFSYPEGVGSVGTLYVPAAQPVRLILTSRDVIHSFFVPAFRLKRDAVPGLYTGIWFQAPEPGRHQILCAEFCGTGHPQMLGEVVVLPPDEWQAWMAGRHRGAEQGGERPAGLAERGRAVATRLGCFACHTVDGTRHIGPTWKDAFGSWVTLEGGERVLVDEAYVTESLMDPLAKVVEGFAPVMPSFQGQVEPPETAALIEYLKSLRQEPGEAEEPTSHER